jgi:hypothetical protein
MIMAEAVGTVLAIGGWLIRAQNWPTATGPWGLLAVSLTEQ